MYITLLTLASLLGYFWGPAWFLTLTLLAVLIKLAPVLIGLAVIAAAAWLYNRR